MMEEKFVLVFEAKRSSLGQAMRQCLLTMKDMGDNTVSLHFVEEVVSGGRGRLKIGRVGGAVYFL
jgi:hypothetical protein